MLKRSQITPTNSNLLVMSSGSSLEMTPCALPHGNRVVATLRKPRVKALYDFTSKYIPEQLLVSIVTKHAGIETAFAKAKAMAGRVGVVFNNAGEVEAVFDELVPGLFNVIPLGRGERVAVGGALPP